jgi:hypothetical protein
MDLLKRWATQGASSHAATASIYFVVESTVTSPKYSLCFN